MPTKTKTLLGGLSLIAFAAIALGVITHAAWLAQLDVAASTLATRAIDPMNTALFKVVATLGSPATVIGLTALLCLWLWLQQGPVVSLWFAGLQLGGSAITEGFKLLIDRSRPLHQLVLDHGAASVHLVDALLAAHSRSRNPADYCIDWHWLDRDGGDIAGVSARPLPL